MEEEEIGDEIREADLVNELIQLTIARIDNFPETLKTPAKTVDAPKDETPVSPSKVVTSDFLSSNDSVESPVNLPVLEMLNPRIILLNLLIQHQV